MYVVIFIGANATMNCVRNIKTELKNLGLPRPDLLIKLEDHNVKSTEALTVYQTGCVGVMCEMLFSNSVL